MTHPRVIPLALLLLAIVVYGASAGSVLGKWDCTSTDERGNSLQWTLAVKDDGGKLSAVLSNENADIPLIDPQVNGNDFTFKIRVNETEIVDVKMKIDGNKMEGTFKGQDSGTGTVKATKQV